MKGRFAVSIVAASLAAVALPHAAAAQCEGGTTVAGFYTSGGSYVPGGCATTNPTTPGQLYPSGAQPVPSTNPALGASRLPGQLYPSGLLPVNSSDLGPAPSFVSTNPLRNSGTASVGATLGPGTPVVDSLAAGVATGSGGLTAAAANQLAGSGAPAVAAALNAGAAANSLLPGQGGAGFVDNATVTTGLPDQSGQAGLPTLNINRAVPSSLTSAGTTATAISGSLPGAINGVAGGINNLTPLAVPGSNSVGGTAYSSETLPAAPARTEPVIVSQELSRLTIAYPGQ